MSFSIKRSITALFQRTPHVAPTEPKPATPARPFTLGRFGGLGQKLADRPVEPTPVFVPRPVKADDTTMQRHVSFFDVDGDRSISIGETAQGLQELGMGTVSSYLAGSAIVLGLGYQTSGSVLEVNVDDIAKAKHDGDTDILDANGHFDADAFERRFGASSSVDVNGDRAFTRNELMAMVADNKESLFGTIAAKGEFGLLVKLLADTTVIEDGEAVPALTTERMKAFYTGDIFNQVAAERAAKGE